jgi:MerR family transcriptional regulator, redox-sensitive transcriptional activator SoxR
MAREASRFQRPPCSASPAGVRWQAIGTVLSFWSGVGWWVVMMAIVGVKVDLMSSRDPVRGTRSLLTIGELARRTGKRPSSIRFYEQIGLLPAPARVDGRRRYDPAMVRTLAVIDTAQRAGLTLDEIKILLSASPGDASAVGRLREVAERKLPEITALLERTELVRTWLELAARCECPDLDQCPLFDDSALDATPPPRTGLHSLSSAGPLDAAPGLL